jgi:predicted hydrocarbon binding protein
MVEPKNREQYVAEGGTNIPQYAPVLMWVYDCTINSFRAILNEVGLNRTIEATRHYNEAWGRAVVGMVRERFGQQANDLESLAMTGYYVHSCTSMGHIKPLEIYEGGAIAELFACPNPGMRAPPEMCIAMSHIMANSFCQCINPNYEVIYTHHMGDGDDCCRWVLKKKSSKFTIDNLGRLEKTIPLELSMDERISFASRMVIMSQLFNFTAVLNDLVGPQRTLELVIPLAKETGLRLGAMMKGGADVKGDLSMIKDKMDFLVSPLQQSGPTAIISSSGIEKEILDCPFKGCAPEVCKQFEGVFNGVCEAINPDYEFAYDSMMSKGDSTCHWVVRKKGESGGEKSKEEMPLDDPMKILKMRFAKGEISEEEYRRQKAVLFE